MVKRVGLLTLPLHTNYGGILQAAALYQYLMAIGKEVVFLEREQPMPLRRRVVIKLLSALPFLPALAAALPQKQEGESVLRTRVRSYVGAAVRERKIARHYPFRRRYLPLTSGRLGSGAQMAAAVREFKLDAVVVGSDQVWRLDYAPGGDRIDFFLGFAADPSIRKISYAASFGRGSWTYPELTAQASECLARFHAVSVRETSGIDICAQVLGRKDARHVLDPTLLIDPAFFDSVAAPSAGASRNKLLLSYMLDEEPDRPFVSKEVASALGGDYAINWLALDDSREADSGTGKTTIDVPSWLRAFMDADFVVTDSFHGTVFSIIFKKNFIAILNESRGTDRFTSLLDQLGLRDRLVTDPTSEKLRELATQSINFAPVEARLDMLRAQSAAFLQEALA